MNANDKEFEDKFTDMMNSEIRILMNRVLELSNDSHYDNRENFSHALTVLGEEFLKIYNVTNERMFLHTMKIDGSDDDTMIEAKHIYTVLKGVATTTQLIRVFFVMHQAAAATFSKMQPEFTELLPYVYRTQIEEVLNNLESMTFEEKNRREKEEGRCQTH